MTHDTDDTDAPTGPAPQYLNLQMEPAGAIHPVGRPVHLLDQARARMKHGAACVVVSLHRREVVARNLMRETARELFARYIDTLPELPDQERPVPETAAPAGGIPVYRRVRPALGVERGVTPSSFLRSEPGLRRPDVTLGVRRV